MFTGLVRDLGVIEKLEDHDGVRRMTVRGRLVASDLTLGASVSHSGVCLTVVESTPGEDTSSWVVEAVSETLNVTTLGSRVVGDRLNLEPSLRLGDELGGHLVFGHVDGLGSILSITEEGGSYRVRVKAPSEILPMIAYKGSITVDGISLTVAAVSDDEWFELAIIPHTWDVTSLGLAAVGDQVHLEIDMLARYVARQMSFKV
jgi:riboflavin synthase